MEVFKDIVGYKGLYQISNLGRIKSLKGRCPIIMRTRTNKRGYIQTHLHSHGYKTKTVHRLVAVAFINNKENKPCVNHKNGIKTDNRVENLEWSTYKENTNHSIDIGVMSFNHVRGINHYRAKLNVYDVLEIRKKLSSGATGVLISKKYNVSNALVSKIKSNKLWKHI